MLKNKITYLLILAFLGVFAILYYDYFTGLIFLVALLLPFILFIILIYTLSSITARIDASQLVVSKGESFDVNIIISNKSIFPISRMNVTYTFYNEFLKEVKKDNIQISMDGKCTQEVRAQITSSYCGNIVLHLKSIRVYDFIHIWSLRKKMNRSILVTVLPNCHISEEDPIRENNILELESNEFSEYKSGDDPSEVFMIREYREGDKPHRIHWKLSYKQDELMIKEFSYPINTRIVVLVDFYCGQRRNSFIEYVDGILECFMSLSFSYIQYGYKHLAIWWNKDEEGKIEVKDESAIYEALDGLYHKDIMKEEESILCKDSLYSLHEVYSHIIYITTSIDLEHMLKLIHSNKETLIYIYYVNYLELYPVGEETKKMIDEYRINLIEIELSKIENSFRFA